MAESVTYQVQDGVGFIALNRPERMNAVTSETLAALLARFEQTEADNAVRVVVITGSGRGFCTGLDLKEPMALDADGKPDLALPLERDFNPLAKRLMASPKITVAAMNGPAVGAGAGLALACDIVVAAKSAYLQIAFVRIGLVPDAGLTWFLPRIVGHKLALALALTGDRVAAEEAKAMGLIYRVFEDETFQQDVLDFVKPLRQGSTQAHALIKQAFRESAKNDFDAQLNVEARLQDRAAKLDDFAEALSAFRDKRAPVFK